MIRIISCMKFYYLFSIEELWTISYLPTVLYMIRFLFSKPIDKGLNINSNFTYLNHIRLQEYDGLSCKRL